MDDLISSPGSDNMKYKPSTYIITRVSYRSVTVRRYGQYNVNGFHFGSTKFEATHPLAATCNTGIVTRAIDAQGREINYYGVIQDILEFSFSRNKKLKVVFL